MAVIEVNDFLVAAIAFLTAEIALGLCHDPISDFFFRHIRFLLGVLLQID